MNKMLNWLVPAAGLAIVAVLWYVKQYTSEPDPVVEPAVSQQAPADDQAAINAPVENYPIEAQPENPDQPLPALADSDAPLKASLEMQFGAKAIADYLIPTDLVRHVVATVDNLPRQKLAVQLRPLRATTGSFRTAGSDEKLTLSKDNYVRYQPLIQLIQTADVNMLASWYRRFYPLFQEAYQGLGYPKAYFNDRLVAAIDDLLDTPEIHEPIRLTQPKVFYQFADPQLESRSAGQKTLLRMGPDNIAIVKMKLRELRAAVTQPAA